MTTGRELSAATIRWREGAAGMPSKASTISSTGVFVTPPKPALPTWDGRSDHLSVRMDILSPPSESGEMEAIIDFMAPEIARLFVYEGACFIYMAGDEELADVRIDRVHLNG